jgi:DNA-binding beta-propeller fold protein YncE
LAVAVSLAGISPTAFGAAKPPNDPLALQLVPIGRHTNSAPFNTSQAEIVAHDPATQRLFVVNAQARRIDVLDIHNPTTPVKVGLIDLSPYGAVVNSVAVHDGLIAVAVEATAKTDLGRAVLVDQDLQIIGSVVVGALPDMLTFTPDGRYLLVANEGEPNTYNDFGSSTNGPSVDPEGSISIIDLSNGPANPAVRTATFTAFNNAPLDPSIRIYGPNATVAQDLEPEYIAVSADSTTAWVTLQENNALATVDLATATVTRLDGLGFKDHSVPGSGFDASDRDGAINIATWPVLGVYMPDSIAAFQSQGQTFLVMANEGDARAWPGFNEEARVETLTLDPTAFPNASTLQLSNNLGRLTVSIAGADPDNDGDADFLFAEGGRSFSIRTTTGALVFDSGDQLEQATATLLPANFNASHTANARDGRSPNKGPEPEGLALGKAFGRMLAFVACERIGGIFAYDISDPFAPRFVDYVNFRNFANPFNFATAGDLGPEGVLFISAENSPNGKPLVVVAHEVSGSTTIFQVEREASR